MNIKLGNIVSEEEIIDKQDHLNYYLDYNKIKNGLPILIIGWNLTKELFVGVVTILDKNIGENLFWTFSKKEKLIDYNEDLETFNSLLSNDFIKDIKYINIDPIINKFNCLDDLYNYLFKNNNKYYTYISNNMMYFSFVKSIYGIDLNIIEFLGFDKEKLIEEVKKNSEVFITKVDDTIIQHFNKIEDHQKYVPYIVKQFQ